jgi:DNA topoisomerase-1
MSDAKTEKTTISIAVDNRKEKFVAVGEVILFQGFLKVYIESKDEERKKIKGLLPPLTSGKNFLPSKFVQYKGMPNPQIVTLKQHW